MRPASSVRFHGEASRFTASDPLRQPWGKVWRTLRGTSVRAGGVLQLSNGDESPEGLRQKERRESVGGVERIPRAFPIHVAHMGVVKRG